MPGGSTCVWPNLGQLAGRDIGEYKIRAPCIIQTRKMITVNEYYLFVLAKSTFILDDFCCTSPTSARTFWESFISAYINEVAHPAISFVTAQIFSEFWNGQTMGQTGVRQTLVIY